MTEKQKRFCQEYLIDANATRAYKAVYTNVKNDETARANASRLLTKANIKQYIEEEMKKIKSEKIATAVEAQELITKMARDESIEPKDRLKALDMICKWYALYTINNNTNVNIAPVVIKGDGNLE